MADSLTYWIRRNEHGWFDLCSPFGDVVETSPTYEGADSFRFGEMQGRYDKRWYRNLISWIENGFCTHEELAVLLEFCRLERCGRLKLEWNIDPNVLRQLACTESPTSQHLKMLENVRMVCEKDRISPASLMAGIRELAGLRQDKGWS